MAKLSSSGCASGSGDHVRRGLLCGVKPEHVMTSGINIFDPKLSVEDLWGDVPLSGGALLEHVLAYYSDGELDVPFFQNVTSEDSGQRGSHRIRSVVKSPLSRELQESTVECYKQRIFTESISQLAAGYRFAHTVRHRFELLEASSNILGHHKHEIHDETGN